MGIQQNTRSEDGSMPMADDRFLLSEWRLELGPKEAGSREQIHRGLRESSRDFLPLVFGGGD